MLMKKILSIAVALLMILSLASCNPAGEEATTEGVADENAPVVSLLSEKTTVSPGEEIKVTVHISEAPLTACFDIYVFAEDSLEIAGVRTCASELILAANSEEKNDEEYVAVTGMVATTYDVLDDDICNITYKVKEDALPGTKINLTVQVPTYQLGTDESGNDFYNVECNSQGLVLEVQ